MNTNVNEYYSMFKVVYPGQKESAIRKRLKEVHNYTKEEITKMFEENKQDLELIEDKIMEIEKKQKERLN